MELILPLAQTDGHTRTMITKVGREKEKFTPSSITSTHACYILKERGRERERERERGEREGETKRKRERKRSGR